MAYVINYLPIAKKDLLEIVDYISEKLEAPRAALNFIDEIEKKIMGLKANPYSHRLYRPSKPIDTEYRLLTSISQNSVSFVKCSWKSGQKSAFPHKSKVAFPKTEVLGKPPAIIFFRDCIFM
jgi:plasmid stabilization system protein ParE